MTDLMRDFPEHRGFNIPTLQDYKRDIFILEQQVKMLKQALLSRGVTEEEIEDILY